MLDVRLAHMLQTLFLDELRDSCKPSSHVFRQCLDLRIDNLIQGLYRPRHTSIYQKRYSLGNGARKFNAPESATVGRNELQGPADSLLKEWRLGDQAEDQIALRREIVEMSRLDQHVGFLQQANGKVFVRPGYRNSKHSIPAAFDFQPPTKLLRRQL